MPQIVRVGKFIVTIYVNDHAPAHVHVRFDDCVVRVIIADGVAELDDVIGKATRKDVLRAVHIVADHMEICLKAWKAFHG